MEYEIDDNKLEIIQNCIADPSFYYGGNSLDIIEIVNAIKAGYRLKKPHVTKGKKGEWKMRKVDTRHEFQVFLTCRREIELLKNEMMRYNYSGKIIHIEPCIRPDGAPRIRVIVEKGSSPTNWSKIINAVRSQTTARRYKTREVINALVKADLDDDEIDAVMKKLYPEYISDMEDFEDWENEEWYILAESTFRRAEK